MKTLNVLRGALAVAGSLCFAIGWLAAISHGTFAEVQTLGNTLIVAGAILVDAVLISSAIVANKTRP
jgi:predicted phage tail protein